MGFVGIPEHGVLRQVDSGSGDDDVLSVLLAQLQQFLTVREVEMLDDVDQQNEIVVLR